MGCVLSNSKQYKKLYPLVNLYLLSIKKKYIKIDTINAPGDAITAILNNLLALSMWKGVSRYPKDVLKSIPRNADDIPNYDKLCPTYPQDMHKICPKICQKDAPDMP